MMRLDVEGLSNTFKLFEGSSTANLMSLKSGSFRVLGRQLLPLLQLLPTAAFIVVVLPSSPLRRRWAPRRHILLLSVTEDL
jgi:hypothetical protein